MGDATTTVAKFLARKQQLLERLQEDPGPHEREKIERLLKEIDTALNLLDKADTTMGVRWTTFHAGLGGEGSIPVPLPRGFSLPQVGSE